FSPRHARPRRQWWLDHFLCDPAARGQWFGHYRGAPLFRPDQGFGLDRSSGSAGCRIGRATERGSAPSSSSSVCLIGSPPPYPVNVPLLPMIRWQGITIGIGLRPFASPTARTAFGWPTARAISPYDAVRPYVMFNSASHTRRWNGVPCGASGTSNSRRSPAKYSSSCRITCSSGRRSSGQPAGGAPGRGPVVKRISVRRPSVATRIRSPIGLGIRVHAVMTPRRAGCAAGGAPSGIRGRRTSLLQRVIRILRPAAERLDPEIRRRVLGDRGIERPREELRILE